MVLKTREKLIEVARQLFACKGVENTTMNDIATASDKGRRTIYTYFKNKREIYNAVIEQESEHIVSKLREIITLKISSFEKLEKFFRLRFTMLDDTIARNDSFRTIFSRDIKRVSRIQKLASAKEIEILKTILDEGVAKSEFILEQANRVIPLFQMLLHGMDMTLNHDNTVEKSNICDSMIENVIGFVLVGIKRS